MERKVKTDYLKSFPKDLITAYCINALLLLVSLITFLGISGLGIQIGVAVLLVFMVVFLLMTLGAYLLMISLMFKKLVQIEKKFDEIDDESKRLKAGLKVTTHDLNHCYRKLGRAEKTLETIKSFLNMPLTMFEDQD